VREIELLNNKHTVVRGVDSETWRELRDLLIRKKIITQNDKGHYLLSRDLNSIKFWQLKEWVNDEQPLDKEDISAHLEWQENAYSMLREQRSGQRDLLQCSLVELYTA
jgi:membrane protein